MIIVNELWFWNIKYHSVVKWKPTLPAPTVTPKSSLLSVSLPYKILSIRSPATLQTLLIPLKHFINYNN